VTPVLKKVLAVSNELDSSWLRAVRRALRAWATLEVITEQDALNCRQTESADLMIVDAAGIDGDAAQVVKCALAGCPQTPIVVATLAPDWQPAREAFLAGASDYVQKSLDPEVIRKSFRGYLASQSPAA
jgi:DNA-binding NarL/FixJ family response regulator